jgi:hypothetical protein
MKIMKILGATAVAALALMAFTGTASATTLEIKGVKQTGAVTLHLTLEPSTSLVESATGGGFANTCTESTVHFTTTTPFTATRVGGPVTGLTFSNCTESPLVVDAGGYLEIETISGTTNGTLLSKNLKFTSPSPFGALTCTTSGTGTDIGTITGKASGNATWDLNAVLNCGFFLPSTKWEGAFAVTSPEGLGVTS